MPFHAKCWEEKNGKSVKRAFPAKFDGPCDLCSDRIHAGDMISWTRRGKWGGETSENMQVNTSSTETPKAHSNALESLAEVLYPMIEERLDLESIQQAMSSIKAVTINVVRPDLSTIDVGLQHKHFPRLLAACNTRKRNAWVAGPAGSGKTTAAENVAKALGLKFYYTGAVSDPYALLGFIDANGNYKRTMLREAYEHGGVFLWDEVDGSDPTALVAFNALLANGVAAFPDGMVTRHPDCVIIAAANTWGHGATHEYVGRNKLDGAFLDRFVRVAWPYDLDLELAVAPNMTWTKRVQAIRKAVMSKGLRVLVTPRASFDGADLLSQGLDQSTVEEMTMASAMTPEQWDSVKSAA